MVTYLTGASLYLITFIILGAIRREAGWRSSLTQVSAAVVLLAVSEPSILPLFHYLQADGFYPQLFGIIVLFIAWCGYTTADSLQGRAAVLVLCVLLSRFTYVLNTGELLVVIGFLAVAESRGKGHQRSAFLMCAAAAAVAAVEVYKTLLQLAPLEGGLREYDLPTAIASTVLISLAVLFYGQRATSTSQLVKRSSLFVGLYGLVTAIAQLAYLAFGLPARYYLIKHGFYSILLLAFAGALTLTFMLSDGTLVRSRRLLLAALVLGLGVQAFSLHPYYASYYQRATWSRVTPELYPLADRQAEKIISDTLSKQDARFGGFITSPYWPLCQFMNASFGYFHYRRQPFYRDPAVSLKPGRCVFWNSTPDDLSAFDRISRGKVTSLIAKVSSEYPVSREAYQPTWKESAAEISFICIPRKRE